MGLKAMHSVFFWGGAIYTTTDFQIYYKPKVLFYILIVSRVVYSKLFAPKPPPKYGVNHTPPPPDYYS